MKYLVYISDSRLPTEKANGYHVMKMCEAFAAQGMKVTLLHPKRMQPKELMENNNPFTFYGIQPTFTLLALRNLDTIMFATSLPVWLRRLSMIPFLHFFSYAFSTLHYCWRFRKRKDVFFYGRAEYAFLFLTLLKRWFTPKMGYEAHSFPRGTSNALRRRIARSVDLLVVITDQLRQRFEASGVSKNRIVVAHDGVDLATFRMKEDAHTLRERFTIGTDRYVIGYIGRFHTMGMEKGIRTLLKAIAYLKEQSPKRIPLLLCVGGPLSLTDSYRRLCKELGLEKTFVRFEDHKPVTEVPSWIAVCDVVTIPFPWNEHMAHFASPMKLFEYMAMGKPIVASALPALQEILQNGRNALLVPPDDALAFADAFRTLMNDTKFAERIGRQALNDIQAYSWAKRARTITKAFDWQHFF